MGHVGCFHAQVALFFLYFDPQKLVLSPKVIVAFRNSVKLCLLSLIHSTEGFH